MAHEKGAKGVARSAEVRAAVIAALLAGQSVSQVAKAYKLPKGTVSSWKKRKAEEIAGGVAEVATGATQTRTRESIGDLLVELVRENLKALLAGSRLIQDLTWLRTQSAAEIGTLLGITHDKTVRMLEAMDADAEPPADVAA